jgi:hypothetical protein
VNPSPIKYLLASVLLFACFSARAETLVVPYSSFYSHSKKIAGEETNALQFAFGFKQVDSTALCTIDSAYIHTQKQDLPLSLIRQQRFTVPSNKILKMARATVVIALQQEANRCDMSVQLETKAEYLTQTYSKETLHMLLKQYQAFFKGMGSFLSFMMPEVQGLKLHFSDDTHFHTLPDGLKVEKGKLLLSNEWIAASKGLELGKAPLRITAEVLK